MIELSRINNKLQNFIKYQHSHAGGLAKQNQTHEINTITNKGKSEIEQDRGNIWEYLWVTQAVTQLPDVPGK